MESLEVHSKDFLIKWINVPDESIVKWQVKPLKKSIFFRIYRPVNSNNNALQGPVSPVAASSDSASASALAENTFPSSSASSSSENANEEPDSMEQKLQKLNLQLQSDLGRLQANELYSNEFSVDMGRGGIYAFVFDNRFSKSVSKKILFNQFIDPQYPPQEFGADGTSPAPAPAPVTDTVSLPQIATTSPSTASTEQGFVSADDGKATESVPSTPTIAPPSDFANKRIPSANSSSNFNASTTSADQKSTLLPPNPRARSANGSRERSSSVYTLSQLLDETGPNEDYEALVHLRNLQLPKPGFEANNSTISLNNNNSNNNNNNNLNSANNSNNELGSESNSIFRKKPSHSSLGHRNINRHRSNSQNSVRTNNSLSTGHSTPNGGNSNSASTDKLSDNNVVTSKNGQYLEGYLLKRKRKKNSRSYSKRFFSLNFKYGVLDYYLNDQSLSSRGNMHIKLVEITANKKTKEITLDSGLEIWHLKALNESDWKIWVSALDIIRLRANYLNNSPQLASAMNPSSAKRINSFKLENAEDLASNLNILQSKLEITKRNTFNLLNDLKENHQVFSQYNSSVELSASNLNLFAPPPSIGGGAGGAGGNGSPRQLTHKNSQDSTLSVNSTSSDLSKQDQQSAKTRRRKSIFSKRRPKSNTGPSSATTPNSLINSSNNNFSSSSLAKENSTTPELPNLNTTAAKTLDKRLVASINDTANICDKLADLSELLNKVIISQDQPAKLAVNSLGGSSAATAAAAAATALSGSNLGSGRETSPPTQRRVQKHLSTSSISNSIFSEQFFDAHEYIESIKSNDGVVIVEDQDDSYDDAKEDDGAAIRMSNEHKYQKNVVGQLINHRKSHHQHQHHHHHGHHGHDNHHDHDDDHKEPSHHRVPSTVDETDAATITSAGKPAAASIHDDLYPLSELKNSEPIPRRVDIKESTTTPPSLLQFLKKNVGKDMSSIAMPVTANEPLTVLQKLAEIFEYTNLIDAGISAADSGTRILHISAFAISYLSSLRSKERNIRKPFMPLLGETYELVRDDLKYRLVLEKVCHKPPIFCLNASSKDWEINSTIMPVSKFWGKSMEIINKGSLKLTVKKTGEVYEWNQPTTILRNLIAGEKYIEPTDTITINCSNGEKSVVEFKAGGMFSGRSEEVTIKAYDANDKLRNLIVKGTWTEKLILTTNTKSKSKSDAAGAKDIEIWKAHALLPNSNKKWGFTNFAAELNEITAIESHRLPPTDSRLRPDLQCYEDGDAEDAERLKLSLEQKQRDRRKIMESKKEHHKPVFFVKESGHGHGNVVDAADGDEILLNWKFIDGEKSYWNRRKNNDWGDLLPLYDNEA